MRSIVELETFISIGEKAENMAKDSFSDCESESYQTAFVAHFKSLLRANSYDFTSEFLTEMADDFNSAKEEDVKYSIGPFFEFGYITQFLKFLPDELEDALAVRKISHGGARKGAGRPTKRPTKQIRIDSDLAESFKLMSDYYQSLDDEGRRDFDNRFSTSGLLFPNG
ncbi:BrnA antitoxin family protein [Candidatus Enterovibrio escicola]|uniref:BrnA antitoxin family protein n=1 Tax=Candidatus Enterovibrio escicola TaxID=1927127 RepID=UPI001237A0AB|nr:BrnA antitoxin family protein [Candidatus Enterovibrio escacola]